MNCRESSRIIQIMKLVLWLHLSIRPVRAHTKRHILWQHLNRVDRKERVK